MEPIQLARFMAKVRKEGKKGGYCWTWLGATNGPGGYGSSTQNKRTYGAHRLAYEHFRGPIPPTLEIDHLCRNTICVNPNHLEAVPHKINCRRGDAGQHNASKTHCPQGHPYSGNNLRLRERPTKGRGKERGCRACQNARSRRSYKSSTRYTTHPEAP